MEIDHSSEIVRHDDGTVIVHLLPERAHDDDGDLTAQADAAIRTLHPGEGGYDEALTAWDEQQHPDHPDAVSTADGRREAMHAVHAVAASPDHAVDSAVAEIDDREASAEALRYVLVGGVHSVQDFAAEMAKSEGDDPLPAHQATKIIGEVLAKLE